MKELKLHRSIKEQVGLMKERGLIIDDDTAVEEALSSINYYRLSGYLHDFKQKRSDNYIEGLTWKRLKGIYDFDRRFTRLLLFVLEDIEETLKARTSYTLTSIFSESPLIYKDSYPFRSEELHSKFLTLFDENVQKNSNVPFVKHHIAHYDGQLPMWVAVELFTMGNIQAFYKNLIGPLQKKIAKAYDTGPRQMENWIENMSFTRNHLAHNMRIYNLNFGRTPLSCKRHPKPTPTTNMIFDQIFIMSVLYSDATEWNNYVLPEINALFDKYKGDIELCDLGFPDNWESILKK